MRCHVCNGPLDNPEFDDDLNILPCGVCLEIVADALLELEIGDDDWVLEDWDEEMEPAVS